MQLINLRLAIGTPEGARSSIWRVWSSKNPRKSDVYVAHRNMAGVEKLSFHELGICRKAFTSQFGTPPGRDNRATVEWLRAPTPPMGKLGGSLVLSLIVPTDFLSTSLSEPTGKPATWIEPAPQGQATVVDFFFTNESESTVASRRRIVSYVPLPNMEAFAITVQHSPWIGENLRVPASHHHAKDLIFMPTELVPSGRPIRLAAYRNAKDGDALFCCEIGGCAMVHSDPRLNGITFHTLSRDAVPARSEGIVGDR